MELKISSFENFNSLSCLITNILHITFNVTRLHNFTLDGWYCKRIHARKESYGMFPYFPVTSQSLFGNFNSSYQQTNNFSYELMQLMWLATSWQLCFLYGIFVESRAQWKQAKNIDQGIRVWGIRVSQYTCEACGLEMQKKRTFPDPHRNWWAVNKTQ